MSKRTWFNRLTSDPLTLFTLAFILFIFFVSASATWIAPYSYEVQDPGRILASPSTDHWFGTDRLGRDLFSRVIYGSQISISMALLTTVIAFLFGTTLGATSGYVGGKLDNFLMRVVDVAYSFPDLLLIILIGVLIGRGFLGILLALSLVSWVGVARLVRGEVLRYRETQFVESARSIGCSGGRILFFHILPNILGPLIVTLTFRIPVVILAESTLSFIGIGISPPLSSWGTLAHDGWTGMKFYPHLILFPIAVIFLTIFSFNRLGEVLRNAFDPEMRV